MIRLLLPFVSFFSILCGYFVLRPVRDEIGVRAGVENIPWLFTGTFAATLLLVPLFGWAVTRIRRGAIASVVYGLCAAALVATWAGLQAAADVKVYGIALFIGISVINLFLISIFWSVMADSHANADARRRYGLIAIGGTAGAIAGPAITATLVTRVGPMNLLLISAGFWTIAAIAIAFVPRRADVPPQQKIGGGILAGIRLALRSPTMLRVAGIIICYTTVSTILYMSQADIVSATIGNSAERTRYFALVDLTTNIVIVAAQALITSRVLTRLGVQFALMAVPAAIGAGLLALAAAPRLMVIATIYVIHRAGEHSLTRPAREVIFTTASDEERYKAKNFLDTFVYRGNDALVAWAIGAAHGAGAGVVTLALLGTGVAAAWALNGRVLGRNHDASQQSNDQQQQPVAA